MAESNRNSQACRKHAEAACALAPDDAVVHQQLAVAAALDGDLAAAEQAARRALNRDDSLRSRIILADMLVRMDKIAEAERVYRQLLDVFPDHLEGLLGVAEMRRRRDDQATALTYYARAFTVKPDDPRPLRSVLSMLGHAGWIIGAIVLAGITRSSHPPDRTQVTLDMMTLKSRMELPPDNPAHLFFEPAEEQYERLVSHSASLGPTVQIHVARALYDAKAYPSVRAIVDRLDVRTLDTPGQAHYYYLVGLLAELDGDRGEALDNYVEAVELDPERWDACCNATTVLMDRGDPESLETAGELILTVPEELRLTRPQLLFNEGMLLKMAGRPAQAAERFEAVHGMLQDDGLGAHAARELAELRGAEPT